MSKPTTHDRLTPKGAGPKRTTRILLATLDILTGLGFLALILLLWTRSTLFLVGACGQLAFSLASAVGLLGNRAWGRLLVRLACLYQLGLLILLLFGILFGASYLWGLYGNVGTGAAAIFLVLGVLLFQLLGLLPVFKLRLVGLREPPKSGRSRWLFWLLSSLPVVALVFSLGIRNAYAFPAWEPLEAQQRDGMLNSLLGASRTGISPPETPKADETDADLYVLRIVSGGKTRHRSQTHGTPRFASAKLAASIPHLLRAQTEPKAVLLDRLVARGPILTSTALFALSAVPGLDGFAARVGEREVVLLPQDLIDKRLLTRERPIPFVPDFRMGVRRAEVERELCTLAGQKSGCQVQSLVRIRTESWLACEQGKSLALHRGRPPRPRVDRETALDAARAAGEYVLGALGDDNRFVYLRNPLTGQARNRAYSLPRHAGTTWFLAQLFGATCDDRFLSGARRGLQYLDAKLKTLPDGRVFLPEGNRASLGVQALTLIAFTEVASAAEADPESIARIRGLGHMLRRFQQPNGDFHFNWDLKKDLPLPGPRKFYAAGQAALALSKAAKIVNDPDIRSAARKSMDFQAGPYWDFFLGDFFFLEEHWTCLAALEAWELFHDPKHAQLCVDFGRFSLQLQHKAGASFDDYTGGVGFSGLFPPHTTPTAARAEALVAAATLAAELGQTDEDLRQGVKDAIGFLMHNQIRPEESCRLAKPDLVMGGVGWNYLNPDIRIDTVQHAGSVMLQGSHLLDRK